MRTRFEDDSAGRAELAFAAATVSSVIIGARDEAQLVDNIGAIGWNLSESQLAVLNAASDAPAAYPVWHQRDFPMLHEKAIRD